MIPVTFNDCAGFLHSAKVGTPLGRGVVICESFGYEALCARRAVMALAEMMAEAGLPTLRFSYPGTGDSAGAEAEGAVERWIDSIAAARAFLRETTGVSEVALCGIRLGALFAVEAARRAGDVPALALLAPALAGRLFVRELTLSAAMVEGYGDTAPAAPRDWSEFLGFRLYPGDLDQIRRMDVRASAGAGAAARVLVMSPEETLPKVPAGVEARPFPDYPGLAQHTEYVYPPVRSFMATAAWLAEGAPPASGRPAAAPGAPVLALDHGTREEALQFGPQRRCFGVLGRPARRESETAVLILNTGLNHHVGNGRGGVRLARRLNARGVTTLRMDAHGLGDSYPVDPTEPAGFHDLDRVRDVKAALDLLEAEGCRKVLLTGICAGAYIGLHAAGTDPRIVTATLVNLPYFYMRDEDPAVPLLLRPSALWLRLAAGARRLMRGGRPPDLARWPVPDKNYFERRRLINWATRFVHYGALWASEHLFSVLRRVLPHSWAVGRADRMLRRIHRLGVDMHLVYGAKDWGQHELGFVFGKGGARLIARGWARITILDDFDHTVTTSAMQERYARLIEDDLGLDPHSRCACATAEPFPGERCA